MTTPPANSPTAPSDQWTVRRVLEWTTAHLAKHGSETPRLDTEVLLAHARGCRRIDLYTRFDEVLSETERAVMRDLVRRRAQAEPVAYLVGHREFYGLDFRVTADVFIPRPDTETLVMEALELAKQFNSPRILDIGTGSGCIAVSVAVNAPQGKVVAIDASEAALAVARENAAAHNVTDRIDFRCGNLFGALAEGEQFDIILSNPPYVAERGWDTVQPDVRLHEPTSALLAGDDGLDVVRRLVADAPRYLSPGGHLLIEISPEQSTAVSELLESNGSFRDLRFLNDLAGRTRVAIGASY